MKIALISCTKLKQHQDCVAKEMYMPSSLFSKARGYVENKDYDKWFILSAKYGLLSPEEVISPYDQTLNNMKALEIKKWSDQVVADLMKHKPKQIDFYAGEKYRKYVIPQLNQLNVETNIPLKGLGIGQQMQYYKKVASQ